MIACKNYYLGVTLFNLNLLKSNQYFNICFKSKSYSITITNCNRLGQEPVSEKAFRVDFAYKHLDLCKYTLDNLTKLTIILLLQLNMSFLKVKINMERFLFILNYFLLMRHFLFFCLRVDKQFDFTKETNCKLFQYRFLTFKPH